MENVVKRPIPLDSNKYVNVYFHNLSKYGRLFIKPIKSITDFSNIFSNPLQEKEFKLTCFKVYGEVVFIKIYY